MKTFSFRAECKNDVDEWLEVFEPVSITVYRCVIVDFTIVRLEPSAPVSDAKKLIPDVQVEFATSVTLADVLKSMENLSDGHIMRQTLRELPITDNSLRRDTAID